MSFDNTANVMNTVEANDSLTTNRGKSMLSAAAALTALGNVENPFAAHIIEDRNTDDDGSDAYSARIFPQKLFDILASNEHSEIITWLPHGKGFIIVNKKRFAKEILPKFFKQTKYTSFTRKLNRWNFSRVTRGPEMGAYYHDDFQRGEPMLCTQMYCKNERAKFAKSANSADAVRDDTEFVQPVASVQYMSEAMVPPAGVHHETNQIPLLASTATSYNKMIEMDLQRAKLLLASARLPYGNTVQCGGTSNQTAGIETAMSAMFRNKAQELAFGVCATSDLSQRNVQVADPTQLLLSMISAAQNANGSSQQRKSQTKQSTFRATAA